MFPWMPRRLPEWTIISGLFLSVIALALTAYPLFVRQSERAMETRFVCLALVLSALPPCIFLVWCFFSL